MKFKDYINESTSQSIIRKMERGDIPLSPKFMDETFGFQDTYCFKAIQIDRVQSAFKRQFKKNQVSTFFHFKEPEKVFWGVGARNWSEYYPNRETCIVVLHGKVTIKGTTDLWSFPDGQGRRWIELNAIKRYKSDLTKVLTDIQTEMIKDLKKKNLKFKQIEVFYYTSDLDIDNDYDKTPERDSDIALLIKEYFNSAYKILSKYKDKIQEAIKIGITNRAHYNEFVCHSYKVERVFLITDDIKDTKRKYPEAFEYNLEHKTVNQVVKELKKYQKESL
jgi:hypothetical protein